MVSGVAGQCGGCKRYWTYCHDQTYVHRPHRRAQRRQDHDGYGSHWEETPWSYGDGWQEERPRQQTQSPRKRNQSPRQRNQRQRTQSPRQRILQHQQEDWGDKGKGHSKAQGQRKLWTCSAFHAMVSATCTSSICGTTTILYADRRNVDSLAEFIAFDAAFPQAQGRGFRIGFSENHVQRTQRQAEPSRGHPEGGQECGDNAADAKSHKQLIDQLKDARKKLSDLDEQWESYRVQWAGYLEKASQLWLSHVEDYESGERRFAEKRKDLISHLQDTRVRLHDVHMRTMEQGASQGTADAVNAQEALDATMQLADQEHPMEDTHLAQIRQELTGVVKQVKNTIEDRIKNRERSRSRGRKEPDDVEVLSSTEKEPQNSN